MNITKNIRYSIIKSILLGVIFLYLLAPHSAYAVTETITYSYDSDRQLTHVSVDEDDDGLDITDVDLVYDSSGNRQFRTVTTNSSANNPPDTPSNPSVQDGATGVSTTPTLTWTATDPDQGDRLIYLLYFGECGDMSLVKSGIYRTNPLTHYDTGQLKSLVSYCWQVILRDNHNAVTPGQVWSFTTANDAPSVPSYTAPVNASTVYTSDVVLKWSGFDPNPDDELTYDIYFGTSPTPSLYQEGYTGKRYLVGPLLNNTTYYWQIMAKDDHGIETPGPVWSFNTQEISSGQLVSGNIDEHYSEHSYKISLSANESLMIRMGFASNGPDPHIRVYDESMTTQLCTEAFALNGVTSKHSAEITSCILSGGGTYVIVASEYNGDEVGDDYYLKVERLNNDTATLSYGQSGTGSFSVTPYFDKHAFYADASDSVIVRMGFVSTGPDPQIRIYDPAGNLVSTDCSKFTSNGSTVNYSVEITGCVLSQSGFYTVIASEYQGDEVGGYYNIKIDNLKNNIPTINPGDTIVENLSFTADFDKFTYFADAGDRVRVRISTQISFLGPYIRIIDTDGVITLCEKYGYFQSYADYDSCLLPNTGIYTVIVSDYYGDEIISDFNLTIEKLNNTTPSMSYGDTAFGTLSNTSDLNIHTFDANANDRVIVRMGFTNSDTDPEIKIYAPSGAPLSACTASSTNGDTVFGYSAEVAGCLLADSGTYTITVSEDKGDEIGGDYQLALEQLNSPSPSFNVGENVPGSLPYTSEINAHSFQSSAGDMVMVRMGFEGGGPDPEIRMYDPDGYTLIMCSAFTINGIESNMGSAEFINCLLPSTGIYTLIASEYRGNEIGDNYNLGVEKLNNPSATLTYGQTATGNFAATSDLDAYAFTASTNDRVTVKAGFDANLPDPQIRIFKPDGTATSCYNWRTNTGGYAVRKSAEINNCFLSSSGIYTIIVNEYYGDEIGGAYNLSILRQNNAIPSMIYGQVVSDSLLSTPELDTFKFKASAGANVKVTMGFSANGPDPYIRIFAPDGVPTSCSNYYINDETTNNPTQITNCQLSDKGTYTIISEEYEGDEIGGSYDLHLECISGNCNIPPTANAGGLYSAEEGTPIALDASASIDPDGTIIMYEWDVDNDGIYNYQSSTSATQDHTYNQDGNYTIRLRVTDNYLETDETTTTASISDNAPTPEFIGTPTSGDTQFLVTFINSSTGHDTPLQYEWYFDGIDDGNPDSTETNPTYTYTVPALYDVLLKVIDADQTSRSLLRTGCIEVCYPPAFITGDDNYTSYLTLRDAYSAAVNNDIIESRDWTFTEDLSINHPISISILGGYDCRHTTVTGVTTVEGNITVFDGAVTSIENVKIDADSGEVPLLPPGSGSGEFFIPIAPPLSHPTSTPSALPTSPAAQ